MDAAIEHFAQIGYRKADVCTVVNKLLKVYGQDGWSFLEDACYLVVQEALLEMQQQEEKLQLQVLLEQQLQQHQFNYGGGHEEMEAQLQLQGLQQEEVKENIEAQQLHGLQQEEMKENDEAQQLQGLQQEELEEDDEAQEPQQEEVEEDVEARASPQEEVEEDDEALPKEAKWMDAPFENVIPIVMVEKIQLEPQQEEVEEAESLWLQQDEVEENDEAQQQEAEVIEEPLEDFIPIVMVVPPSEAVLAVEQTEGVVPMLVHPASPRAASSDLKSTRTKRTRRPCYGWISDSESDSEYEEYLARRQQQRGG